MRFALRMDEELRSGPVRADHGRSGRRRLLDAPLAKLPLELGERRKRGQGILGIRKPCDVHEGGAVIEAIRRVLEVARLGFREGRINGLDQPNVLLGRVGSRSVPDHAGPAHGISVQSRRRPPSIEEANLPPLRRALRSTLAVCPPSPTHRRARSMRRSLGALRTEIWPRGRRRRRRRQQAGRRCRRSVHLGANGTRWRRPSAVRSWPPQTG